MIYLYQSDYLKANEYCQKALAIFDQIGSKKGTAGAIGIIGNIYRDAPDSVLVKMGIDPSRRYEKALNQYLKQFEISQENGSLGTQKEAWKNLSITYEKQGDFPKAYDAYKKYIVLHDSIESGEVKNKIESKTMQYDFDKKESEFRFQQQLSSEKLLRSNQEATLSKQQLLLSNKEKDLQHLAFLKEKAEKQEKEQQLALSENEKLLQTAELQNLSKEKALQQSALELSQAEVKSKNLQRNGFIAGSMLLFLLAGAIFIGLRKTAKEKKKSEDLLLNILPAEIAEDLKQKGFSDAKLYNHVSVLFTDFVNFTGISEQLTPKELVQEIHRNFTAFDTIMEKHGVEKIKTIGDAYLAVCGLPHEVPDHAHRITKAALEIQQFISNSNGKFQIRIGIHSGPVVAGIVGVKKFAYDIWGDTVNTANRMESNSEAGKVNISGSTFELLKREFNCVHRGKIEVKGKGEVDMYFVEGKA
ncbi:MAG: adenylate/guanylate cyclase domain-containing protein [Saprospiraceae bacterium]